MTDPCPTATIATEPTYVGFQYTLDAPDLTKNLASDFTNKYTVSPSFCEYELSIASDKPALDAAPLSIAESDDGVQTITITEFTDETLDILGGATAASIDATVTVTVAIQSKY